MYPYSISDALSMNDCLPVSAPPTAPHYAVDVSDAPSKRKRVEPVPYDSTAHTETTQYAAAATSWLPDSFLYNPFLNDAFATSTNADFVEGSSQNFATTAGRIDASVQGMTPQYLQGPSEPPSKRRRVTSKRGNVTNALPNNSVLPGPSIPGDASFTYPAHVLPFFTPSTVTGFPFYESFVEGSSKDVSTSAPNVFLGEAAVRPPYPGAFSATYPHYSTDAPTNAQSFQDYELPPLFPEPPSKRRRGSNMPSKRGRVSRARPSDSVLPGTSIPGETVFTYPAHGLSSFTPSTATGSSFDESFAEGSSKDILTPSALLGEEDARLPPPGAFSATYPHHAPDLARTFDFPGLEPRSLQSFLARHPTEIPQHANEVSREDYELLPFYPGNNGLDFPGVGDDSWRTAYDTPAHISTKGPTTSGSSHGLTSNTQDDVSADGPPASGVSHGRPRLPPRTAPAPSISKSLLLENGPPEDGVALRQHPSGVVTYFDPHKASSHLPLGTRLQLACWHPTKDKRVLCLYRDPFADKSKGCGEHYVDFYKWKRHFRAHSIEEKKYLNVHPEARERAVAIKDPKFADVTTWECERCGTQGSKSDRDAPLKRHQGSNKCKNKVQELEQRREAREREHGAAFASGSVAQPGDNVVLSESGSLLSS